MKILAGLGNPGTEYAYTRHNVGFMFIDTFAESLGIPESEWKNRLEALITQIRIGTEKVILMKPMTYMNESGRAIGTAMQWYKLDPEDIIVVHDDMDIPSGMIRIRAKGSAGGHNGIKSIIAHVGSEKFRHMRIGIGRPAPGWSVVDHVLSKFPPDEVPKIQSAIEMLIPAAECIVKDGIDMAMNRYNPRKQKKGKAKALGSDNIKE